MSLLETKLSAYLFRKTSHHMLIEKEILEEFYNNYKNSKYNFCISISSIILKLICGKTSLNL